MRWKGEGDEMSKIYILVADYTRALTLRHKCTLGWDGLWHEDKERELCIVVDPKTRDALCDYGVSLEAENARLREEMDTIKVAAHMPDDYKYGLPSWVNQVLYENYIGAFMSPHITEQIESGHLIFPKAPVYEENARLRDELSVWREDYALLQEENKRLREAS
jgi:hypothetical protein